MLNWVIPRLVMIFSTCPVLSLHMSLWSYLDMSHGVSHPLSSSRDPRSFTVFSHPYFSISDLYCSVLLYHHFYYPYSILCLQLLSRCCWRVFNLKHRLRSVLFLYSQVRFGKVNRSNHLTVCGFSYKNFKLKKMLFMMFLSVNIVHDKGDGQNLLIKTRKSETHTLVIICDWIIWKEEIDWSLSQREYLEREEENTWCTGKLTLDSYQSLEWRSGHLCLSSCLQRLERGKWSQSSVLLEEMASLSFSSFSFHLGAFILFR